MLVRHLMDRSVGALNRQFHQVFDVVAVVDPVTKRFAENIDGGLGRDLTGLCAADAVGYGKDAAFMFAEE